jgi:hypothetical protein
MSTITDQERAVSNDLEKFDTETLAARAAVLADFEKYIKEQRDRHKIELYQRLRPGSKVTGRHPLDDTLSLGTVTMSDPKPEAFVTNRDEFEKYCRETWPEKIEVWTEIDPDNEEVIEVLQRYAPHLVTVHSSVPNTVKERALDRATREDVPGTKRANRAPVLSVRATANARTVVQSMIAASPVLRELEA